LKSDYKIVVAIQWKTFLQVSWHSWYW